MAKFKRITAILTAMLMLTSVIPANASWENGDVGARTTTPTIRFAVFSDTHVTEPQEIWTKSEKIKPMLEMYKKMDDKLDAFAMVGDIVYQTRRTEHTKGQYQGILDTISSTYSSDYDLTTNDVTDSDKTKLIWAMGNHEISQGATDIVNDAAVIAQNKAEYKEVLGHDPCYKTTVNGYTFIVAEPYDYLNNYCNADKTKSEMEAKVMNWIEEAEKADASKPIFYLQHEPVDDTFYASTTRGTRNSVEFREFLDNHQRVVVLSGHHHIAAQDPRSIWQDKFTLIHTPVVSGGNMSLQGALKDEATANPQSSHCMMIEATDSKVEVYKMDINSGKYIGEPYTFDVSDKNTFIYNDTRETTAKASNVNKPYFPENAAITMSDVTGHEAKYTFPEANKDGESATGLQDTFVHFYNVKVTNKATGTVSRELKYFGEFWRPEADRRTQRTLSLDSLQRNTEYEISITAQSSLGQESEPLTTTFTTTAEKNDEDRSLTKQTDLVNVALGKAAVDSKNIEANYPTENLTDGKVNTYMATKAVAGAYATIDLGKRYSIEKIVLRSREDGINNDEDRRYFEILASNDKDFTNSVKLGGMDDVDYDVFPQGGAYTINLPGTEAYRYVKLMKTKNDWTIFADLEVYAKEYITEVSRYKDVETNIAYYDTNPVTKAVDGKNDKLTDAWRSAYSGAGAGKEQVYGTDNIGDYLIVDLGGNYDVSYVEIESPNGAPYNNSARRFWSVYGTNTLPETTNTYNGITVPNYRVGMIDPSALTLDGFEKLCTTDYYYLPEYAATPVLAMYGNPEEAKGIVSQQVSGKEAYRYIVFKHEAIFFSELGEVRVFVTSPELKKAVKDDNGIKLMFSEPMKAEDITTDNIVLYDTNNKKVSNFEIALSDDGYDAVITGVQNIQKIAVADGVRSAKGAEIAGNTERYLESDVDFTGKPFEKADKTNVALGKPVTGENIAEGYPAKKLVDSLVTGFCATNGKNGAYATIDLLKRYNVTEIKLYNRKDEIADENGRKHFEILGSNDETFASYDVLGGIDELNDDLFPEHGTYTVKLDGTKAYRYIRLKKTAAEWSLFAELEVYADFNMIEVSRNANAYANAADYGTSAANAVDGKNSSNNDAWWTDYTDETDDYLYVDLGASLPVRMIEVQSIYEDTDSNNRRYWSVYGSNTVADESKLTGFDTINGDNKVGDITAEGYTKLASTDDYYIPFYNKGVFDKAEDFQTPGLWDPHRGSPYQLNYVYPNYVLHTYNGVAQHWLDGTEYYRYITFKHHARKTSALGEVKIMVESPKVNGVYKDGDTFTVSFSEKILSDYLTDATVVLTNAKTNAVIAQNDIKVSDYEYTFTAECNPFEEYKITVSENVKDIYSIPMGYTYSTTFAAADVEVASFEIKDADGKVESVAANTAYTAELSLESDISGTAIVAVVTKADNKILSIDVQTVTLEKGTVPVTMNVKTGDTTGDVTAYVWGKDTIRPLATPTEY